MTRWKTTLVALLLLIIYTGMSYPVEAGICVDIP